MTTTTIDATTTFPEVSTTSTSTVPDSPTPPVHRIGARVVDGVGEFYDTSTGERFVPRGMNYNRWVTRLRGRITDDL